MVQLVRESCKMGDFQDIRYVGPYEAAYCLLKINIQERNPSNQCLPEHLERKTVVFHEGDQAAELGNPATKNYSTKFLQQNMQHPTCRIIYVIFMGGNWLGYRTGKRERKRA